MTTTAEIRARYQEAIETWERLCLLAEREQAPLPESASVLLVRFSDLVFLLEEVDAVRRRVAKRVEDLQAEIKGLETARDGHMKDASAERRLRLQTATWLTESQVCEEKLRTALRIVAMRGVDPYCQELARTVLDTTKPKKGGTDRGN